jgi:hypothetical protein
MFVRQPGDAAAVSSKGRKPDWPHAGREHKRGKDGISGGNLIIHVYFLD